MNHDRPWKPRWFDAVSIVIVIIVLALAVAAELEARTITTDRPLAEVEASLGPRLTEDTFIILQPGIRTGEELVLDVDTNGHRLEIRCAVIHTCIFDGKHNAGRFLQIRSDNVSIIGIVIRNYVAWGLQIRYASNVHVLNNIFERIGGKWGCAENYPHPCRGTGAITSREMVDVHIIGNVFKAIENKAGRDAGYIHAIYASQRCRNVHITDNLTQDISSVHYKTRNGCVGVYLTGNVARGRGERFFYSGMPEGKENEQPDSEIVLRDNDVGKLQLYECRRRPDGPKRPDQCRGIVKDEGQR